MTPHFASHVLRTYLRRLWSDCASRSVLRASYGPPDFDDLATCCSIDPVQMLLAGSVATWDSYTPHVIRKRRGNRLLLEPPAVLMQTQREVYRALRGLEALALHEAAHGFVPGRSHATHARQHVGRRIVASVDIQDFFGSVTDVHLWMALRGRIPDLSDAGVRALIRLVTVEQVTLIQYERTSLTLVLALFDEYFSRLYPMTGFVLRAATQPACGRPELDPIGLRIALAELQVGQPSEVPLDRIDPRWQGAAQRMALLLFLLTGTLPASRRAAALAARSLLRIPDTVRTVRATQRWLEDSLEALPRPLAARSVPGGVERVARIAAAELSGRRPRKGAEPWRTLPIEREAIAWTDEARSPLSRSNHRIAALALGLDVRVLPQGAPTSPWLANLVAVQLDQWFARYAADSGLTYTRYADDLAFSGDALPKRFVHAAAGGLERFGFRINRRKVSIAHQGRAQIVTGIVVNERPRPADLDRRTLRAMRHRASRGQAPFLVRRDRVAEDDATVRGMLAYWHMVDPSRVPWPPEGR